MTADAIDYGSESTFSAPVMRIDDDGHGFVGVVWKAETRQATDFETGDLKWFHNKRLVKSSTKPADGAQPVLDYIFHIAVEKGRGAFTRRDENGEAVKLSSGRNALDVRDVVDEDIAVVFSSAWMVKAARSARLNTGHKVRFKRTTPARDDNGDRMTDVRCDIEILGTVDNPQPIKAPVAVGADYGDIDDGSSPF